MTDTPFAGGRWTEAKYKAFIRSALRKAYMRWPVKQDCLLSARRPAQDRDKRSKWEYQCAECGGWWLKKDIAVDHVQEVGSMADMNVFIATLFCEESNLQVLCHGCHNAKTQANKCT